MIKILKYGVTAFTQDDKKYNEMPDWVNLFELPIEHFNVTYPV